MHSPQTQYSKPALCHSVQACWQELTSALTAVGNVCARQEATFLLQDVTRQSPTEFYSNLQRPLTPSEIGLVEEYLARRLRNEPLQYILKAAHFYGREFYVDSRVLIPRPETELLIDATLGLLHDLPQKGDCLWLADVGTGSASIAITLACELPAARIIAIERSTEALHVARANVAMHSVADRVHLLQGDLIAALRPGMSAVVANLPYVRTRDIDSLSPDIASFEPSEALDGGDDGLAVIRRLCQRAPKVLLPGGRLLLEVGDNQADELAHELARDGVWDSAETTADLSGTKRIVIARLAI